MHAVLDRTGCPIGGVGPLRFMAGRLHRSWNTFLVHANKLVCVDN